MYDILFKISDLIGLIGVVFVLIAYFMLSTNRTTGNSFHYQFANLIGSIFILFSLFFKWNTASVLVEVSWILISGIGLWRIFACENSKDTIE